MLLDRFNMASLAVAVVEFMWELGWRKLLIRLGSFDKDCGVNAFAGRENILRMLLLLLLLLGVVLVGVVILVVLVWCCEEEMVSCALKCACLLRRICAETSAWLVGSAVVVVCCVCECGDVCLCLCLVVWWWW